MITEAIKEYIVNTSNSIMASEIQKFVTPFTQPICDGGTGDGSTGDGSMGDGSTVDGSMGDGSTVDDSTGNGSIVTPVAIANLQNANSLLLDTYREYILDTIDASIEFLNSPALDGLDQAIIDDFIAGTVLADLKAAGKSSILSDQFANFAVIVMQDESSVQADKEAFVQKLMLDSRHDLFYGENTAKLFDNIHYTNNAATNILFPDIEW